MNEALKDLIGEEVTVWSNSGDTYYTDTGTLEAYDHPWVRIRRSNEELLCFSAYNIRLLKLD